jgi:hypothetical protein
MNKCRNMHARTYMLNQELRLAHEAPEPTWPGPNTSSTVLPAAASPSTFLSLLLLLLLVLLGPLPLPLPLLLAPLPLSLLLLLNMSHTPPPSSSLSGVPWSNTSPSPRLTGFNKP